MTEPATSQLVHSIALTQTADGTEHWFAASTAGLRHSSDGGLSWNDCYESLEPQSAITTLAIAASPAGSFDQSQHAEPGTQARTQSETERCLLAGAIGGVLRSLDGGQTWSVFDAPAPPPVFSSLAFSPGFAADGLAFAGTLEDGVFRTEDRGRTWAAWNFGLLDLAVLDIAVTPPGPGSRRTDNTLFAATETGVFRSTNGGRAWRETAFPSDLSATVCLAGSPDFATDQCLFAGTESDGMFQSTDGGASWAKLGSPQPSGAVNTLLVLPATTRRPTNEPVPDPSTDPTPNKYRLLALVDDALHLSEDSGRTWNKAELDQDVSAGISCVLNLGLTDGPGAGEASTRLLLGLHNGQVLTASFGP